MNTGFYWVKFHDEWTTAHYNSELDRWEVIGSDVSVRTKEIQEINENKLSPKEKEEPVPVKSEPTLITITIKVDGGGSVEILK